jgi:hypothetical protein
VCCHYNCYLSAVNNHLRTGIGLIVSPPPQWLPGCAACISTSSQIYIPAVTPKSRRGTDVNPFWRTATTTRTAPQHASNEQLIHYITQGYSPMQVPDSVVNIIYCACHWLSCRAGNIPQTLIVSPRIHALQARCAVDPLHSSCTCRPLEYDCRIKVFF